MAAKYFKFFPQISYSNTSMTDITRHVAFQDIVRKYAVFFTKYTIKDGERPETIANKQYGDPGYHCIILLANQIVDPYYGWPLGYNDLIKYVADKYDDPYGVHHYETNKLSPLPVGTIVDSTYPAGERQEVTNIDYETSINESKRNIIIVKKDFLTRILNEFQTKIAL